IHRWDYDTPIEETLEALHDVVKSGKTRYIGASSMFAWQFCKALYLADLHSGTRFVSMQPHYNLLNREEEREMLPLCLAEGIGVMPWSPLARGRLARGWETQSSTTRAQTDEYGKKLYSGTEEADKPVVDRVGEIAKARRIPRANRAGVVASQACGNGADCWRNQTSPSRRSSGSSGRETIRRGNRSARGTVCAS